MQWHGVVRANNMASVLAASQVIVQAERLRDLLEEYVGHPVAWSELARIYEETTGFVDQQARTEMKEILNRSPVGPHTAGGAPAPSPPRPTPGQNDIGGHGIGLDGHGL